MFCGGITMPVMFWIVASHNYINTLAIFVGDENVKCRSLMKVFLNSKLRTLTLKEVGKVFPLSG